MSRPTHCADCNERAECKCSVCKDVFCKECGERHLKFYDDPTAFIAYFETEGLSDAPTI